MHNVKWNVNVDMGQPVCMQSCNQLLQSCKSGKWLVINPFTILHFQQWLMPSIMLCMRLLPSAFERDGVLFLKAIRCVVFTWGHRNPQERVNAECITTSWHNHYHLLHSKWMIIITFQNRMMEFLNGIFLFCTLSAIKASQCNEGDLIACCYTANIFASSRNVVW